MAEDKRDACGCGAKPSGAEPTIRRSLSACLHVPLTLLPADKPDGWPHAAPLTGRNQRARWICALLLRRISQSEPRSPALLCLCS
ncbi:hypothetical protein LDENG_00097440 [Lucifuga dentata]|nr:hypothetical protein LDENG_00097440 [Lucifuga dentata]